MELSDLLKAFGSIRELLVVWLNCLRNPLQLCDLEFINLGNEDARLKRAISVWTVSFALTLVVLLPVYAVVGIGLKSFEFHLSTFLIFFLSFLCSGFFFHIGFLWSGIKSKFVDTFLIQAITVSCYTPLTTLMYYPSYLRLMSSIHDAREHRVSIAEALGYISGKQSRGDEPFTYLSILFLPVALVPLVIFAQAVSKRYGVHRAKVLSSLSFATAVLVPISNGVFNAFYHLFIYIFSQDHTGN